MKPLLDVLIILDALEKEGSFAAASAKLYKTPSALSYTIHKLESDLNIQLLDRSGHRAKFTRTGQMLLEKGREVLHSVRELEQQAVKLNEGWENALVISVDDTFPFSLLTPLIDTFCQQYGVTRLTFVRGEPENPWERLMQGSADIVVGALGTPPSLSGYAFAPLGELEQVFVVAPQHPLAQEPEPLSRRILKRHRAVVVGEPHASATSAHRQRLDDQQAITVFDYKTKLELQLSGLACGYIPRYMVHRLLETGALVAKKVSPEQVLDPAWIGWNEQAAGLASAWWRESILANSAIAKVYQKSGD